MATHYFKTSRRRGPQRLISDYIRGVTVEFYTSAGVFSPKGIDEGTRLLIEYAKIPSKGIILDLGCGYGVIGITLAKAHPQIRVVMTDINPVAIELARKNAKHNGVAKRVEILLGDLYEPVKNRRFDVILSNPPVTAGMNVVKRIIVEAPDHLVNGGSLQLVIRKGVEAIKNLMEDVFGSVTLLARKKGYSVLAAYKT